MGAKYYFIDHTTTIDHCLKNGNYDAATMVIMRDFGRLRKAWAEWRPNPNLSLANNNYNDGGVARQYYTNGRRYIGRLFDIARKTGRESDTDNALNYLARFERDILSSQAILRELDKSGKSLWDYPLAARRELTDVGMAHFAEHVLLSGTPGDQKLRKFVALAYIDEGHFDGALQVTRETPLKSEIERLVLEAAEKLPPSERKHPETLDAILPLLF